MTPTVLSWQVNLPNASAGVESPTRPQSSLFHLCMRGNPMGRQATEQKPAPKKSEIKSASSTKMQTYLDKAVDVLEKFGPKAARKSRPN
jgi:hypothetical protein